MILLDKNMNTEPKQAFQTYLSKKKLQLFAFSFLHSVFESVLAFKKMQNSLVSKPLMSYTTAVKTRAFKHASHEM